MNYFPFFRGKQFELICLRENAALVAAREFTPIIEPVKEGVSGLVRALEELKRAGASFLLVANPCVGHHRRALPVAFLNAVQTAIGDYDGGGWIFQLEEPDDLAQLKKWLRRHPTSAVFHHGTLSAKETKLVLDEFDYGDRTHVFAAECSLRFRSAFPEGTKVLVDDGFKKRKNADYPEVEAFSELRATFGLQGADGFGDYLIVGKEYSEGGGAAYAVAIHLTYVEPDEDNVVFVRHFISDTNDTPSDPAGKFREALSKLVKYCGKSTSKIPRTRAVDEFRKLYQSGHFPGLGYVKKLSMQHHLEIIGD